MDEFVRQLREAMRHLPEEGGRLPIRGDHRNVDEFKAIDLPEFVGGADPEMYLDWERKIERLFDFKELDDEKRCRFAILKLSRGASLWWESLKAKRDREGKARITSWDSLKRKLRRRYVPATHRLSTFRKIADFKQGKLSVGEYIEEFENLCLMGELEEVEDQKMTRFLRGLNTNVANTVELYPYADFDTLCGLCLKVEAQSKLRYGGNSSGDLGKTRTWSKPESTPKQADPFSNPFAANTKGGSSSNVQTPKTTNSSREVNLAKTRCFKCQGFGHFQNACPNKRIVTLREAYSLREELWDELEQEEVKEEEVSEEEEEARYDAPHNEPLLVLRTLQVSTRDMDSDQRDQLFHTKCRVNDKWCSVIIDGGSCTNVASTEMVTKLGLTTMAHPRPYALHWLSDEKGVKVTKQVRVGLTMGVYSDEILCDVIPMDASAGPHDASAVPQVP